MSDQQPQQMPRIIPFREVITPDRFAGQTVIVTGAASGIGRATALRVAREGGRVIAADWSGDNLDRLVAEHADLDLVGVQGDVGNEDDVARLIAACDGRVDGLVNNAGIMDGFATVSEVTDEMVEKVFHVNVWGVLRTSRAVLPLMLQAGRGSIVNLTSMAGLGGGSAGVAYTASKHAVVGITANTAVMYGADGIRCNAVAPGAVMTGIGGQMQSARAAQRIGPVMQVSMPGLATPEALAATITFLLSDDAANTNGAILTSDGGWNAL